MAEEQQRQMNKVYSQAELEDALADFRTRVLELVRKKAEEWESYYGDNISRAKQVYEARYDAKAQAARELEKEIGELK
jgi:hypothetical protein